MRELLAGPGFETERIVDEDGRLGKIDDYMNPYTERALQPALQKILEQSQQFQKQLNSSATSAGAFGDARHGIAQGELYEATNDAVGDTSSKFLFDAFNKTMADRGRDRDVFLDADQSEWTRQLQALEGVLTTGREQQSNDQSELDAQLNEFLREYGHDFNVLKLLQGATSSAPYSRTTTQTQPDNSLMGLLGGLGGAFAGSKAGSGLIASGLSALA